MTRKTVEEYSKLSYLESRIGDTYADRNSVITLRPDELPVIGSLITDLGRHDLSVFRYKKRSGESVPELNHDVFQYSTDPEYIENVVQRILKREGSSARYFNPRNFENVGDLSYDNAYLTKDGRIGFSFVRDHVDKFDAYRIMSLQLLFLYAKIPIEVCLQRISLILRKYNF